MLKSKFTPEELKQKVNSQFEELKFQSTISARAKKQEFLQARIPKLVSDTPDFVTNLWAVVSYFKEFCFFPDIEIRAEFKRVGIPTDKMKWFVPIEEIDQQFNNIEKDPNLFVYKSGIAFLIKTHLDIKFKFFVLKWANAISKNGLDIEKYARNFSRRMKYGKGEIKRPINDFDIIIQHLFSQMEDLQSKDERLGQFFEMTLAGETKTSVLTEILDFCLEFDDVSERSKFTVLFDLFRLICKDEKLKSENEFREWTAHLVAKGKNAKYDGDYDNYKYSRVKALLRKSLKASK